MRLLHVTDPHLFADPAASLRGTVTHASLRAVLDNIRAAHWQADAVAVTGDLIQDDSAEAYVRFRDHLQPLGLPVYCVPGNHDVRELMAAAVSAAPFMYCHHARIRHWLIIGIDSCHSNSAAGYVADGELERLRNLLADTRADHVLVCLHHPPLELDSRWLDAVGLQNRAAFLDVLGRAGNVRGCLFGHAHQAVDGAAGAIRLLGTPSTCSQFKARSEEFAIADLPPAYRRLLLRDDGVIESELVWVTEFQGVTA